MTSRARWLVLLVSTPLVALITVGFLLSGSATAGQAAFPHLRVFQDVMSLVYGAYVEDVDPDKVMDGAMRGLADALDASSAYLSPREVQTIGTALPAADVGVVVTRQYYLRVVGVRDGSPAAKAGVRSGDLIRMIDDAATRDLSAVAGMRRLAGAPGSQVRVVVIRDNAAEPHTLTLTREARGGQAASARRLPGGEAYVRVSSFAEGATPAIKSAIESVRAAAAQGVIVDLRDVADGPISEGIAAARLFIGSGVIATLAGRDSAARTVTQAAAGDGTLTMPLVLLVSNGTGHAAEVFAAALAGQKRAELVGQPTAGLAAEQKLIRLPEGYGLWLTHARYLTASGTPLHEEGLTPDVTLPPPVVAFGEDPPAQDVALARAVERLKARKTP